MVPRLFILLTLACALALCTSCSSTDGGSDPRREQADAQARARWGKGIDDLAPVRLDIISPHNVSIQKEYADAFRLHAAVEYGWNVQVVWRDVGGGGSTIMSFIGQMYKTNDTCGIDILWGGGDYVFIALADKGCLQPLDLAPDVLENVPAEFGGLPMRDARLRWCGSAVSGFGFLYNAGMLRKMGRKAPQTWDDLGGPEYADLISLVDPTMSGSAATLYEMILQSEKDWPAGWAKLLAVLSNARQFNDSAGGAANAPALGETLVAGCIDFYGAIRVAEAPSELAYISPAGQTGYSADPIGILKNPPHPQAAKAFIDFALSRKGQALWALRVGEPDGPIRNPLGRQPVRRDVYTHYAGKLSPWIVDPYQPGVALTLDPAMRDARSPVLKLLVKAAAVDNRQELRDAKRKLIATNFEPARLAEFNRLPENIDTLEKMKQVAAQLSDKKDGAKNRESITSAWTLLFREKYQRVAQ